jgi:hypothetical protein
MRRRGLITLLAGLAACAPAAALAAGGGTASVSASVGLLGSGRAGSSSLVLEIARNGAVVYDQPVHASGCAGPCRDVPVPPGKSVLHVLDLDGNGEPEVVLGLFTRGANCCFIDQVFSYDPGTQRYVTSQHNFLDAGATLTQLGARWVFKSGDSRVTESGFTDTADSGTPLQLWRFSARQFSDVTRRYPALIRSDAAMWMRVFNRHVSNGVGLIAAWAADEDLLGQSVMVDSTLRSLAAQDKLRTPLGLPQHSATAFVDHLEKLLHKLGYTR